VSLPAIHDKYVLSRLLNIHVLWTWSSRSAYFQLNIPDAWQAYSAFNAVVLGAQEMVVPK
jgi:hypothetical protein